MKILITLLLFTLGEYIEANLISIITILAGWIASAATLVWKLSQIVAGNKETANKVDSLTKAFAEHSEDLYSHTADSNVHTTFEQRQAINARFGELKQELSDGHNRIENKIDRLHWYDGCRNCGSQDLIKQGSRITATGKRQSYQCKRCGSWMSGKHDQITTIR